MRADGAAFSRPYVDALVEVAGSPDAVEALLPSLDTVARALESSEELRAFATNPAIGRRLVLIDFRGPHAVTVDAIATGFGRPLDVVLGPEGDAWVADFSNAFFSSGSAAVWRLRREDADNDGTPDACER